MATNPIFGVALCAGVAGLELGLEAALEFTGHSYRTIAVVEREADCAARFESRVQEGTALEAAYWDHLSTFDGRPWRGLVDIVTAGFPCQPFSLAGKRKGTTDERWIWPDIARIIRQFWPTEDERSTKIIFLENVPGLLLDATGAVEGEEDLGDAANDDHGGMGTVLRDLAALGFDAEWDCISASDVGASHRRKRVFILAYGKRARLDGCAWRWLRTDRPALPSARSEQGDGIVADAGRADHGRGAEPVGVDRSRAPDHDSRASGDVADAGGGQFQEPERRADRRDGFGSASAALADAEAVGRERGEDAGRETLRRPEHGGGDVADAERVAGERWGRPGELAGTATAEPGAAPQRERDGDAPDDGGANVGDAATRGRRELREPSGDQGRRFPDGSDEDVGDAARAGHQERRDPAGLREHAALERTGGDVAHAARNGEPRPVGEAGGRGRWGVGPTGESVGLTDILGGIFAPGPGEAGWSDVLLLNAWLRPSIAQAEIESAFRNLADGLADLVVDQRTDALRAAGNGVVPLQAAMAFILLALRAGLLK